MQKFAYIFICLTACHIMLKCNSNTINNSDLSSKGINGFWQVIKKDPLNQFNSIEIINGNKLIMNYTNSLHPDTTDIQEYDSNYYAPVFYIKVQNDTMFMTYGSVYYPTNDGNKIVGSHWVRQIYGNYDTLFNPSDSFTYNNNDYTFNTIDSTLTYKHKIGTSEGRIEVFKIWVDENKLYQHLYYSGDGSPETIQYAGIYLVRH